MLITPIILPLKDHKKLEKFFQEWDLKKSAVEKVT